MGGSGAGQGQLNRPSGMALDRDGHLLVVDTCNHRIQIFTTQGRFLAQWGGLGNAAGQFDMPWGVAVNGNGEVFVTDWRNDRVQKFSSEGRFLLEWGSSGTGEGQFTRPAGIAVDGAGLVYVVDWLNDRLQIFDTDGRFLIKFLGDATISAWGEEQPASNPEMVEERRISKDLHTEKRFCSPRGIKIDRDGRIFVVDPPRGRIQAYRKVA
jgi:DNA-binding beta-propeller fold protein YncE